jgi:hypothetical protein
MYLWCAPGWSRDLPDDVINNEIKDARQSSLLMDAQTSVSGRIIPLTDSCNLSSPDTGANTPVAQLAALETEGELALGPVGDLLPSPFSGMKREVKKWN